jgi:hypothetical protein
VGQSRTGERSPGICAMSITVVNSTNFAFSVGSTALTRSPSGKPIQGTTIDQPSTHRWR